MLAAEDRREVVDARGERGADVLARVERELLHAGQQLREDGAELHEARDLHDVETGRGAHFRLDVLEQRDIRRAKFAVCDGAAERGAQPLKFGRS